MKNSNFKKDMRDFEEYIKNVLKIPIVNLEGIDENIAFEIIVGLELMYEKYPFFNKVISSVEDFDSYVAHQNILINTPLIPKLLNVDYLKFNSLKTNKDVICSFIYPIKYDNDKPIFIKKGFTDYFAIVLRNAKVNKKYKFRCTMYHEFAHLMDSFMHISTSNEFLSLIDGHDIKKEVSEYATENNEELLAEAFMYYIFYQKQLSKLEKELGINIYNDIKDNHISHLIIKIGQLIDKKYKEFTKQRNLIYYNKVYDFNKKFIIKKNNNYVIPYDKLYKKIK